MPVPPALSLTLLDPPHQLVTGHSYGLHAQLHNASGKPWLTSCAERFIGVLMKGGSDGYPVNGANWHTLIARQFPLDVDERVELPGDVEARGPYAGANAPLLPTGRYWLVVRLTVRLERSDSLTRTVEVSCPVLPLEIVARRT